MIRYFAYHPTAANLLMLTLLLFGLVSLPKIKRETFPEFAPPYLIASVAYSGASPEQVENSLCIPMENALDGLSGIEELRCEALEGIASMRLKLSASSDISSLLLDVQTQINAIDIFPDDAKTPVVRELEWSEPVVDLAISANMDWIELKNYAEQLKRQLQTNFDVSLVSIYGFSDRQIQITLNEVALRQLGLSVTDVAKRLEAQSLNFPLGELALANKNVLLRLDEQGRTPKELGEIVILAGESGSLVTLSDIATLTEQFSVEEQKLWFDKKPSAVLKISKNKADDALKIKAQVAQFVEEQQALAPEGVSLNLTNDFSSLLWDRLVMMVVNGLQGVVLVFGVMWFFFSWRYSFWVAAGLPVAFMGSFFLMAELGLSINIMSLVALLMAIGIMMDDAIVISESIAAFIDKGVKLEEAVVKGVQQVLPGVVSSYLTTVCIFGSLLFIQGEMGAVLKVVPMVLILVLTVSLVEAFLILPHHLLASLSKEKRATQEKGSSSIAFKRYFLAKFESVRTNQLKTALCGILAWRYAFLGVIVSLFLISLSLFFSGTLKFVGFPELDGDIAEARLILPPGSSFSQTEAIVAKITAAGERVAARLSADNEKGQMLVAHISEHFNANNDADEKGKHIATVRLDLLSAEIRTTRMDDFLAAWEKEVGPLAAPLSLVFKQPQMGPGGRAFDIRLQHDSLAVLKEASVSIQQFLSQFQGVSGVLDDMRPGKEEIQFELKQGAERYGITSQLIASQLQGAFFGIKIDDIQLQNQNIEIEVSLEKNAKTDLAELANFPIVLTGGQVLPLSALVTIHFDRNYVRIQRIDGARTLSVYGDVTQSQVSISDVLNKLKTELVPDLIERYPTLNLQFEGQSKDSAKTGRSMGISFMLGVFGIFVILSYQFKSYLEPFIVLLAIPLSLIGVIWGHVLLGYPLSMPSLMGFVSLSGVVVNDSILLVQFIRQHLNKGAPILDAVVSASQARFRAVFLTSLTTAVGLLPLLLETSLQAQVVKPLVISIVFGIFASTLLVLFMIPVAYMVIFDFKKVNHHQELPRNLGA